MAQTDAILTIQHVTQSHLSQIVTALFVMAALGEAVTVIGAGRPRIEVRRVVGQQTAAHQLFLFPNGQQL